MTIKKLPDILISRIAAGEVIERPASVVKEFVENSIDAQATNIEITIKNGGRNYISITDNGIGIKKDELELAITRHATSKLQNYNNLLNINSLGFRGEGLASIASVSRFSLISKHKDADLAWKIETEGGENHKITPSQLMNGTRIIIKDLFFATPARLKFLKSESVETSYIIDIVKKIAKSHPNISFFLKNNDKTVISLAYHPNNSMRNRIQDILKQDFIENSSEINYQEQNIQIKGFASIPTYNRGTNKFQYFFVNKRPIKDRILLASIKIAYKDYLANNRHPIIILFIQIDPEEIDINVHPTKSEIRFRDTNLIKIVTIRALKQALEQKSYVVSTEMTDKMIQSFHKNNPNITTDTEQKLQKNLQINLTKTLDNTNNLGGNNINNINYNPSKKYIKNTDTYQNNKFLAFQEGLSPIYQQPQQEQNNLSNSDSNNENHKLNNAQSKNEPPQLEQLDIDNHNKNYVSLGIAKCQLHTTYIVSQTNEGLIIIDQHAAHERLLYEKMKKSLELTKVSSQRLLMPEIVEIDDQIAIKRLIEEQDTLLQLGIKVEKFGANNIKISEIPILLQNINPKQLLTEIIDNLEEFGGYNTILEKLRHICSTKSCHNAIRAGKTLNIEEMNALLREMEETPFSGQCNHGRPTYIKLNLKSLNSLFDR